tara:strand:- start:491 stop:652 length:162 start_codon:yes stop_codon:yes gene_type:complete
MAKVYINHLDVRLVVKFTIFFFFNLSTLGATLDLVIYPPVNRQILLIADRIST